MSIEKEYQDTVNAMNTSGGVSEEKIETAERELNITFPPSYREFLTRYGAGMGVGFEIAGLFEEMNEEEPPMWRNVVPATKQRRRVSGNTLPQSVIPISDDGQGLIFYLDTTDGNECVVGYGPGIDGRVVSTSFKQFVVKAAKGDLNI